MLSKGRNKCVSTVKEFELHDEVCMITDRDVLASINDIMKKALTYARPNHPAENKLPLKDKSLSPKKKKCKAKKIPTTTFKN